MSKRCPEGELYTAIAAAVHIYRAHAITMPLLLHLPLQFPSATGGAARRAPAGEVAQ